MSRRSRRFWNVVTAALAATGASAQTLFYGGDLPDNDVSGGTSSFRFGDRETGSRVFDDFRLDERSLVTGVFGNFSLEVSLEGIAALHYEIRRGMSVGNGGAIVSQGDLAPSIVATGRFQTGGGPDQPEYNVSGTLGEGVTLDAGTYFLTVQVVGVGGGNAFLTESAGANAVGGPIGNANSFLDIPDLGINFDSASTWTSFDDYSLGLRGQPAPVPEPSALACVALGLAMAGRRRVRV